MIRKAMESHLGCAIIWLIHCLNFMQRKITNMAGPPYSWDICRCHWRCRNRKEASLDWCVWKDVQCLETKITVFFSSPLWHQLDRKREEQELINWKGEGQAGIKNQAEDRETTRYTTLKWLWLFTGSRNMFVILNAVPVSILHRVVENRPVLSGHICHGYQHSTGKENVQKFQI